MQQMRPDERREFQRLHLTHPIPGVLGTTPVQLVEIGILGARVQHADGIAGDYAELSFKHHANDVVMKCELVRANRDRRHEGGLETALRFLAAIGDSGDRLRDLLAELVMRELDFRRTHPGSVEVETIDGDKTVRGSDAGFLCYRFENGGWTRRRVFLPEQPSVGFTVARSEE